MDLSLHDIDAVDFRDKQKDKRASGKWFFTRPEGNVNDVEKKKTQRDKDKERDDKAYVLLCQLIDNIIRGLECILFIFS